ncbi:T9SS type A sorting domain-containing protein [Bacteroidota bacterium]
MKKIISIVIFLTSFTFYSVFSQDYVENKKENLLKTSQDIIDEELPVKAQEGFLLIRDGYQEWEVDHWNEYSYGLWHYNDKNQLIKKEAKGSPINDNFVYDTAGNLTYKMREFLINGEWISVSIDSFFYDNDNNLIERVWIAGEYLDFQYYERNLYKYNDDSLLDQIVYYEGYDYNWYHHSTINYEYDENNNRVRSIRKTTSTDSLVNNYMHVWEYNDRGLLKNETLFDWDYFDSHWFILNFYESFYNSLGQLVEYDKYHNAIYYTDSIKLTVKKIYTYYIKGNTEKCFTYTVDKNIVDSSSFLLDEFEYDENNNLIYIVSSKYIDDIRYNEKRVSYNYQGITDVVENKTEAQNYLFAYSPYPLPASDLVRSQIFWDTSMDIESNEINVYDIFGLKVEGREKIKINKQSPYSGILTWDCSGVPTGIYFIHIRHGSASWTLKVVVNR